MSDLFKEIKNIIFDFGGVVFEINPQLSVEAFKNMGIKETGENYSKLEKYSLFEKFETGKINTSQFHDEIRKLANKDISDFEIDYTWNKMLLKMPEENIEVLMNLKNKYNTYLLSNTNELHCKRFEQIIHDTHGVFLQDLFHKVYYSHLIGMRKPDIGIYNYVLNNSSLNPKETLFIDDAMQNIDGAEKVGIRTKFLKKNETIKQIFGL